MGYVEDLENRVEDLSSRLAGHEFITTSVRLVAIKKTIAGRQKFELSMKLHHEDFSYVASGIPIGTAFHTTMDGEKVWYIEYQNKTLLKEVMDPSLSLEAVALKMATRYNVGTLKLIVEDPNGTQASAG